MAKTFGEWVRYFIEQGIANEQNAISLVQAAQLRGEIIVIPELPPAEDPNLYYRDDNGFYHILEHPQPGLALWRKAADGSFYPVSAPKSAVEWEDENSQFANTPEKIRAKREWMRNPWMTDPLAFGKWHPADLIILNPYDIWGHEDDDYWEDFKSRNRTPPWDGRKQGMGVDFDLDTGYIPSRANYEYQSQIPRYSHVVQPGETLESIAAKYGISFEALRIANGISNPALIRPGMSLIIPAPQGVDFLPKAFPYGKDAPLDNRFFSEKDVPLVIPNVAIFGVRFTYPELGVWLAEYHTTEAALLDILPPGARWAMLYSLATSAEENGFDDAARFMKHFLLNTGEYQSVDVDKMLAEMPLFKRNVEEYLGGGVGSLLNPENTSASDYIVHSNENYTVYSIPLDWRLVGLGGDAPQWADIHGLFGTDLNFGYGTISDLMTGKVPVENAPQEVYDWFIAMNKFYYHPRITVVVDERTGEAELTYQVVVKDRYAWFINFGTDREGNLNPLFGTGAFDEIMARMDAVGAAENFIITGESGVITIRFNVKDYKIRCVPDKEGKLQPERYYDFAGDPSFYEGTCPDV